MMREKAVCESRVEMAQVMFPPDANRAGNIHGGSIMKLIDTAAGIVAMRHCRTNVVTASMDRLDFYEPVFVGELVILRAAINYVGNTSMEVGVRVEAEDLMTGNVPT
jgi:acyl-CoA hydrolase